MLRILKGGLFAISLQRSAEAFQEVSQNHLEGILVEGSAGLPSLKAITSH